MRLNILFLFFFSLALAFSDGGETPLGQPNQVKIPEGLAVGKNDIAVMNARLVTSP